MTHPQDNSQVLKTTDEIRDYEFTRGSSSRQAEVDSANTALDAEQKKYADHMATHNTPEPPDPEPEPEPPKPPTGRMNLVGMSSPAPVWAQQKRLAEATGGDLQSRRVFLQGFGSSLTLVNASHAESLVPLVSYKIGDWGDAASGKQDSAAKSLATNLAKMGKKVLVGIHHEPDEQSTPADQGEGGSAQEFAAMYRRLTPLLKAAPNVEVWPIMNGWWWTSEKRKLTDAQIAVWLPSDVRKMVDGIAADDYSPEGGEPGVVKLKNRLAWMKRVGDVKATGVGETNGFVAKDFNDIFALAKVTPEVHFCLAWNSDAAPSSGYKMLTEVGLMDDFQKIVLDWPKP